MRLIDEDKVIQAATYYVEYKWTMLQVAENMCIGETTVRTWLNKYLRKIDYELWQSVQRKKQRVISDNQRCREESGRFKKWYQ